MRVLVLSPHPDDEAIGCGGSLHRHHQQDDAVRVIHLTSGEQGGHGMDEVRTRTMREKEALRAAAVLGAEDVQFWRQPDGALQASTALVERLRASLLDWAAERVYAPHGREDHRDHRAAWRLAWQTLRAGQSAVGPDPELWLYEVWTPLQRVDAVVDIGAHLETKLKAIRCHRSQVKVVDFAAASRGIARYRGELLSWPDGEYAEVFAVAKTHK